MNEKTEDYDKVQTAGNNNQQEGQMRICQLINKILCETKINLYLNDVREKNREVKEEGWRQWITVVY